MTYQEKRDTLNCDIDAEEAESAKVVRDVEYTSLDVSRSDLLILIGSALQLQSLSGNHAFALVQEPAIGGAARHQEWCTKAYKYCEKAFEEKDVTPGVDSHRCNSPWRNTRETSQILA
jgi:hypothetical protein